MIHVQQLTEGNAQVAFAEKGYTDAQPSQEAAQVGFTLEIVKLAEPKKGFVLVPKRRVVERTFGWQARFRRLNQDYERPCYPLADLQWLAAVFLMPTILF